MLVVQAVWRGSYLFRGFYTQDDFRMLALGEANRLTVDFLFQDYAGHVWPGGFLIAWLTAHGDPSSWTLTATSLLAMQGAAGAVMWLVLTRLLGDRWARVPVFAVFVFSPLTLWSLQWWAQAIGYLPVTLCLLLAVWALLVRVQDGRPAASVWVVVSFGLGLSFQERALLILVVLAGLAVALEAPARPWRRVVAALVRLRWLWSAAALLTAAYLVLHLSISPLGGGDAEQDREAALGTVTGDFVLRTLLPGLAGGPWQGEIVGGSLAPPVGAVVAGAVVAGVLCLVTVLRGGGLAVWSWSLLAGYVLADIVVLYVGRTDQAVGLGLVPRYAADVVPVATICLALAVRSVRTGPTTVQQGSRGRRVLLRGRARGAAAVGPAGAALVLTGIYVASAAVSTTLMGPHQLNEDDRAYVERLRDALRADPAVSVYDAAPPDNVMISWFEDERRVSTVLVGVPERPVFDVASSSMVIPDQAGDLRPIELILEQPPLAGLDPECGVKVTSVGARLLWREPVEVDRYVLRLEYYTDVDGFVEVDTGESTQQVVVEPGLRTVDVVVSGTIDEVGLRLDRATGSVCVTDATLGFPVPDVG